MSLTVEKIVEKYRDIISERTFATDLRCNVPAADAIKVLTDRRELIGDAAAIEHRIKHFRQALIAKSRIDQISQYLELFSSTERIGALVKATLNESPDIFWRIVMDYWNVCDGTRAWRTIILDLLRVRSTECLAWQFLSDDDRRFFDTLSWPLTVYRGCGARYVRGISWTIDRTSAKKFALGGRFPPPKNPVVATASIDLAGVFFVSAWRKESEIVLDPYEIRGLRLARGL